VPGWDEWAGMCYSLKFGGEDMNTYNMNKDMCSNMGSTMLRITTQEAETFIEYRLSSFSKDFGVWLGLHGK
jgi:hypothetical protein